MVFGTPLRLRPCVLRISSARLRGSGVQRAATRIEDVVGRSIGADPEGPRRSPWRLEPDWFGSVRKPEPSFRPHRSRPGGRTPLRRACRRPVERPVSPRTRRGNGDPGRRTGAERGGRTRGMASVGLDTIVRARAPAWSATRPGDRKYDHRRGHDQGSAPTIARGPRRSSRRSSQRPTRTCEARAAAGRDVARNERSRVLRGRRRPASARSPSARDR